MVRSHPIPRAALVWLVVLGCASGPAREEGTPPPEDDPAPQAVTSEDIERNPGRPIEQILMDRFPGVVVGRAPDGSLAIRIRGTTSLHGSNEPLFVIDGVGIEPGPGGALFGINPYDIESIEVLKDAASTTMYGIRGANGVIVIKTKQIQDHDQ